MLRKFRHWWTGVDPVSPEPHILEIDPEARYIGLVDRALVSASQAEQIAQSLPSSSTVYLIDCFDGKTPKDVVQLFRLTD